MWTDPKRVGHVLLEHHYLGPTAQGRAWVDDLGVLVLANPRSRRLPLRWLELTRWCILPGAPPNAGSQQWARVRAALLEEQKCSTVISYSDPSQGHTGALYRACNWRWAPTWHRLRPPPTGNGAWTNNKMQSVKDRWVDPLLPDNQRSEVLQLHDESLAKKYPEAVWTEPVFKRGRPHGGGVPYKALAHLLATPRAVAPPSPRKGEPQLDLVFLEGGAT